MGVADSGPGVPSLRSRLPAGDAEEPGPRPRVTVPDIRARKGSTEPLVMVTAYDTPSARVVDRAGVDMLLVGDSLGMVVLGLEDTLQVTVADMVRHTAAVARADPAALVVADLPWLSYHTGRRDALRHAARLVRAGAGAVKLEGGRSRRRVVAALVDAGIPVVGHLGLTPQSVHAFGGYRVQARDEAAVEELLAAARSLEAAGCFALVVEGVPAAVGAAVTAAVGIPVIGIGAGPATDGQVLVYHDLLGYGPDGPRPRFVRRYAALARVAEDAVRAFAADVRAGRYPGPAESYGSLTATPSRPAGDPASDPTGEPVRAGREYEGAGERVDGG